MAAKKCTKCGEVKPPSDFRKAAHHKDGLTSQCKACCNSWIRAWYFRNKEERKKTQAVWHEKNKERRNKNALAKYYANKDAWRRRAKDWAVALASGGSNDKSNLQLLCKSCNCRKNKKDPISFMRENGYLL